MTDNSRRNNTIKTSVRVRTQGTKSLMASHTANHMASHMANLSMWPKVAPLLPVRLSPILTPRAPRKRGIRVRVNVARSLHRRKSNLGIKELIEGEKRRKRR